MVVTQPDRYEKKALPSCCCNITLVSFTENSSSLQGFDTTSIFNPLSSYDVHIKTILDMYNKLTSSSNAIYVVSHHVKTTKTLTHRIRRKNIAGVADCIQNESSMNGLFFESKTDRTYKTTNVMYYIFVNLIPSA